MTSSPSDVSIKLALSDDDYVWSHSRIKQFDNCKYGFYMKYILGLKEEDRFFSQFGSFVHKILEKYFKGEIEKSKLYEYYICNFNKEVNTPAPSPKIFASYFNGGAEYFKNFDETGFENIVDVEKKLFFKIGNKKFVGIIDLLAETETGKYILVDHKSKMLKPRSGRKKPTVSDNELDEYLNQLYLYAIPLTQKGIEVDSLMFNCFRNSSKIKETFYCEKMKEVEEQILAKISEIENNTKWTPNLENEFFCRNLCGFTGQCEYFQMCYGKGT